MQSVAARATTALLPIMEREGVSRIFPGSRVREACNRFATRWVFDRQTLADFLTSRKMHSPFVPAEAGTQELRFSIYQRLGPRFRGDERSASYRSALLPQNWRGPGGCPTGPSH